MNMVSQSFSLGLKPVEAFKLGNTKKGVELSNVQAGGDARFLDVNIWLPRAAESYRISGDIRDYVIVPVPSIITSIPNTNGDSASFKELTRFLPDYGMLAYRTWVGKPTFVEHDNRDITKAKGVILDSYLRPLPKYPKFAKLVKLLAFDRTKDSILVDRLLNNLVSTYSMGMYYSSYTCSICGARAGKGIGRPCIHTKPMKPTYMQADGRIAYRQCEGLLGFETSVVADPAYISAQSNLITDISRF
jgi:hypothetical protein